jgi:hypothetical protein
LQEVAHARTGVAAYPHEMKVLTPLQKRSSQVNGYQVQYLTAGALLLVAISAVVALDGTAVWARSGIQFASFTIAALGTGWLIRSARAPRIVAPMVVYCAIPLWGALQLMLGASVDDFATRNAILDSAVFGALYFIAVQTFEHPNLRRRLLDVLFAFAFVVSVTALFSSVGQSIDRDHYCVFIELLLPIGLYRATERHSSRTLKKTIGPPLSGGRGSVSTYKLVNRFLSRVRKQAVFGLFQHPAGSSYVWAALSASIVASALVAGSTAGCVLIGAELVAVPLLQVTRGPANGKNRYFRAAIPVLCILVLVAVFAAAVGWQQLASRFEPGGPRDRGELAAVAINMAHDRPLTGFGLGSFEAVYPAYALFDKGLHTSHAHNDWAEWAATGGLPLPVLYLTVFGLALPLLVRKVWAIGVVAMCLHALVDFPFEIPALLVLNAILMGAASAGD